MIGRPHRADKLLGQLERIVKLNDGQRGMYRIVIMEWLEEVNRTRDRERRLRRYWEQQAGRTRAPRRKGKLDDDAA